ncbi:MAG: efflux RND transporter periplasmic adaptor subunit [Cyclobacteriaceae bacterium]|nr:MAG: efflux RND transporter periplasmic adaptor subunit [Cyclobacteriaceae bacterium]
MKRTKYTQYALVFALAVMLVACGEEAKEVKLDRLKAKQSKLAKQIADMEKQINSTGVDSLAVRTKEVAVIELQPRAFDHYVQTQGLVESEDNILVSAKGMGVITQVFVKEGQSVTKGQTLAQIDNSVLVRNIEAMKSQLELATSVYERQKNLWDQKIGTEVQFLQAKTSKEGLEKQLAALQEQNEQTRIKSPINGIVDRVNVKVGENIAPGMPAALVTNNSNLKITASISEAYVADVKKGNRVTVVFPDIKKEMKATVTFVGRNIDRLSRTFQIEAELPSTPDLRPNMTALIKVVYESHPAVLVVPVNTVQHIKDEKVVFTIETNGNQTVVKKNVVAVAGVFDGLAQVEGLNAGDKVVSAGFQGLNEGQFVTVQ